MSLFPILAIDESMAPDVALPAFIVARDGLYLRKRSLLGLSQVQVDGARHLPPAREHLEYGLPKLSAALMGQVLGFFGAVWRAKRSEALVLLTWDGAAFGLIVPEQRAGAASVRHRLDPADVPARVRLVGSIHSHGGLDAFASLTDEADEADVDGVHIVVGDLDARRPSYSAAVAIDGRRFGAKPSTLFEQPRRAVDPPVEWLAKVKPLPALPKPKTKVKASSRGSWDSARTKGQESAALASPHATALDALLAEAREIVADLGYTLEVRLEPVTRAATVGAAP